MPALVLSVAAACAPRAVPSTGYASTSGAPPAVSHRDAEPADTTSILNGLTKDVTIGSTIDTKNGDQAPRALSIANGSTHGALKKGELVFCNFENSAGDAGTGTTIEGLKATPGSTPVRFFQSETLKGCAGVSVHPRNGSVYAEGLASGKFDILAKGGKIVRTYGGKMFADPFWDLVTRSQTNFAPSYVFVGTTHGTIISVSTGFYGNGQATEVSKGFAVSKGSQGQLAPGGFQYDQGIDSLYIVDGASNTIVAVTNASKLLQPDAIVVQPGGKKFKCKSPKTTCAHLVYSGSPLAAPVASALLPNGNLIVANTQGTPNTLVELTPQGKVLATKVVDQSSKAGVFGLAAHGTTDSNTVLYYTDTNSNTVEKLEP
jgi:hypothetical protein